MTPILSPKKTDEIDVNKHTWYAYYASYSHSFTKSVLINQLVKPGSVIVDPWNGSGTTTYISSLLGFKPIGLDLNPVMIVVAQARQATKSDIEAATEKSLKLNSQFKIEFILKDPLNKWFTKDTTCYIRKIEKFILNKKTFRSVSQKVSSLTVIQTLLYLSLFNTLRDFVSKFIPSNPTWIKTAKLDEDKIHLEWRILRNAFLRNTKEMNNNYQESVCHVPEKPHIILGSSTDIPLADESVDFVLSSPPYCTRIDYAVATLPELSLLCQSEEEILDIRRSLMGTTTVPKKIDDNHDFGLTCNLFLKEVYTHTSRASNTYYYKNLYQYFSDLFQSLGEISRVLKQYSKCVLVVQDSFYKNIHCKLPDIIKEMSALHQMKSIDSYDFISKRHMANINSKSKKYRVSTDATESVIFFVKE